MKKFLALTLALLMVLSLCACGKTAAEPAFADVRGSVEAAVSTIGSMSSVDADFIAGSIGVEASAYTEASVFVTGTGTAIDEFGVFKCADAKAAEAVKTAVEAYIQQRIDSWMGYTPEELPKLENAEVEAEGSYVFYGILSDGDLDSAKAAFEGYFPG